MIKTHYGKPGKAGQPQCAAVLCRISHDAAGDQHGVDDQEGYLVPFGEDQLGWGIKYIIKENEVSASRRTRKVPDPDNPGRYVMRTDRPDFRKLLRMIYDGEIDGLIVREVDRTVRDGRDIEDLIDAVMARKPHMLVAAYRGDLQIGSASQNMMTRQMANWAKGEADKMSERMTMAKRRRAAEGKYRGGPRPYGFEKDGVTIRESEAAEIRLAADMLLDGETLSAIGRDMRSRGVVGTGKTNSRTAGRETDGLMRIMQLRQILMRARNAGLVESGGEIIGKAVWEPIIPEEKWRAVCAILSDPSRRTSPGPAPKHLGSGIFWCGECWEVGKTSAVKTMWGSDPDSAAYLCKRVLHLQRKKKYVDAVVVGEIVKRLADPKAIDLTYGKDDDQRTDRAALARAATGTRRKLAELDESYKDGRLSIRRYEKVSEELERQLAEQEAALNAHYDVNPLRGIAGNPDAAAIWATLPIARQRAIVQHMCDVFLYKSDKILNQYMPFDPETVQIDWLL
jgi:DNA invertase Pin-like site-specific DNA recombinase